MSTLARMTEEMKAALRAGDSQRLGALRFLLAQLSAKAKDKQGKGLEPVLSEEEIADVLRKEAKKRKESIALYEQGGRNDLAQKEAGELSVIQEFSPKEASREEIVRVIDETVASGAKDFPGAMKAVMAHFKGAADGKVISEILKGKLQ